MEKNAQQEMVAIPKERKINMDTAATPKVKLNPDIAATPIPATPSSKLARF